jgi:ABC-type uncharacterized transport system permease subunit
MISMGLVVAVAGITLAIVGSSIFWGRDPSRLRTLVCTLVGIVVAVVWWILVAQISGLTDTDGSTVLLPWMLVLTVATSFRARARVGS